MTNADLYELTDHAAGWQMPIRVTWINSANAEVTLAEIPLLKIQRKAIEDKLTASATSSKDGKWFIPERSLRGIANPADIDETNPERLVRWKQPDPDLSADIGFVHGYCKQKYAIPLIKDPALMQHVWASIEKFLLQWLVTEGRPLKLSFGRFDACIGRRGGWSIVFRRNRVFRAAYEKSKALIQRKEPEPEPEPLPTVPPIFGMNLEEAERLSIQKSLDHFNGKAKKAAEAMGMCRRTFYRRLKKYGITGKTRTK